MPSVEDVAGHITEIRDVENYIIPDNAQGELAVLAPLLSDRGHRPSVLAMMSRWISLLPPAMVPITAPRNCSSMPPSTA